MYYSLLVTSHYVWIFFQACKSLWQTDRKTYLSRWICLTWVQSQVDRQWTQSTSSQGNSNTHHWPFRAYVAVKYLNRGSNLCYPLSVYVRALVLGFSGFRIKTSIGLAYCWAQPLGLLWLCSRTYHGGNYLFIYLFLILSLTQLYSPFRFPVMAVVTVVALVLWSSNWETTASFQERAAQLPVSTEKAERRNERKGTTEKSHSFMFWVLCGFFCKGQRVVSRNGKLPESFKLWSLFFLKWPNSRELIV